MASRLSVENRDYGDVNYVRLCGVIDEDNELSELTKQVQKHNVLIHAAEVERINSCGVRDWVTWLGELNKKNCKVYLVECSPAIMTQVNLVNNFVSPGSIVSFYAPYFCPKCESDKMLLIRVEDALKTTPFQAPTCRCDQCDHTMEFDDIESSYFAFLKTAKQPALADAVNEALKRVQTPGSKAVRTRTTGNLTPSSIPSTPTVPSEKHLDGLLTDVSAVGTSSGQMTGAAGSAPQKSNTLLYVIVGLLGVAIALLAFAVLRK